MRCGFINLVRDLAYRTNEKIWLLPICLIISFMVVELGHGAFADSAGNEGTELILEQRFHVGTKSVFELRDIWNNDKINPYIAAIKKFPDFNSCFGDKVSTNRDELEFPWRELTTEAQLEICLFHLAEHVVTPESLSDQLANFGFKSSVSDIFGKWPSSRPATVYGTIKLGRPGQNGLPNLRYLISWIEGRSLSIGIVYDVRNSPYSANATVIRK